MCDCFHLAFPNWHAASSGTGAGRRLRGPEPGTEDDSICDEPSQFTGGERPRPQGSSPVEEFPETEKYTDSDKECEAEHDPQRKSGSGKKTKKSGLGSMFEKRSTPKMSKLKEVHSPESEVIVKTAKDGCAEGLIYGGGGKDGIFIKEVVPESPASKSLKLKEGDQILSATVYFDNVSYEDAIQILEHAQAYKVKLCLKRKPDITETEPAMESDVIPEEELYAPEMREQGKTKRRGDARISWPKFPSFGKGKGKSRFTRSHSSSEADEQRKLELSPTTSDTESPIKSQDALKGKKRHKMKLSLLTKRGRISSSEDQDTDTATTGQISGNIHQTHEASDMLSPECLESPSGEPPEVYVTEDLKVVEDLRPQTVQHKVELITIDSTLKTADLTVALGDKEKTPGIKSPDGKKKKKERSELKMKILGKDKSHKKDAKAKSSPKRLKTLGASIEIADQAENETSDVIPSFESQTKLQGDQLALDAKTQIIHSESSKVISAKSGTTQMEMSVPKVELNISDVAFIQKSPQKSDEKTKKGKDVKQKQDTKTSPTFKLPKISLSDIANEETIQKMNVNVEECTTKIEQLSTEGGEVKRDPYERLSKSGLSRTQLPKREDIEIPGMEDMSMRTSAKGIKEPKAVFSGHYEEIQAETVPLSIDVDSVKEAVSKLPGFKLPKVDTSGVPIPEEITVIDANAQRISVKTPTKVVDPKTKHEAHFTKFDITASPEISKTTVKLPKMTPADLTSEELLIETMIDFKKPEKKYKTKAKQSDSEIITEVYKREDIIIPGKESTQEAAFLQTQESAYESTATLSPKESDKKSKKSKITTPGFGIAKPDIKIPDIGIDLPKQNISKSERTLFLQEVETNTRKGKGHIGGLLSDVKIPDIDAIEYIDSAGGSPAKKDGGIKPKGFGVNLDAAKPNADISFPEIRAEVKDVEAEEHTIKLPTFGAVTPDLSVHVPDADKDINIDGAEIKGKGSKFKMPNIGISMPKVKGPKIDLSQSKKDVDVTLPEAKAEVKLPEVPEVDVTLEPGMEIKALQTEHELDGQGSKFKMPKFGIKMPKIKGPEFDLSVSKKDIDVTLPKAEVKLPDVEHTEPGIKVDAKTPEIAVHQQDVEGSSKFKMPTFKLPKFGVGTPDVSMEVCDMDRDVKIEGADINMPEKGPVVIEAPSFDIEGPSVDMKTTGTEYEGKGTKFKMPHLGFSIPKDNGPQINLSLSKKDIDVTQPEVKLPEVPEVDVTLGNVDVSIPEQKMEVEKPGIEIKPLHIEHELDGQGSKFKMPKFGIKMPKIKGPDFDSSLSRKDIDVQSPEAEVKFPYVEHAIKVEAKAPEITVHQDVEGSSKFKMPTFKLPKFGLGAPNVSVEVPDMDKDVKIEEAELNIPEEQSAINIAAPSIDIEAPSIDMKTTGTEQDGKGSKFKMPHLGFSMPKVKGPKIDLSLPKKGVDITLPEAKADVKLPDVNLGKADVSIPEAEMEVKKPELEMQSLQAGGELDGQGEMFKMPKFGIKIPKVKGPEIDLSLSKKDVDVTLPQTKVGVKLPDSPKIDVSLGKAEVLIPEAKAKVEKPELEIKSLQTEAEGQGSTFKKFGMSMPKVKGPEFHLGFSKKDVDVTLPEAKADADVDLEEPSAKVEIKAPEIEVVAKDTQGFKMPNFSFSMPKVKRPDTDLGLSKRDTDITLQGTKAEVKLPGAPKVDASLGKAEVLITEGVKKPDMEIKPLETDVELEGQEGKFKMPKFGITIPKVKGPDIDLNLSKKDVEVTLPEAKVRVKLPDVELKEPSARVEIKDPEIEAQLDVEGSPSKFKLPTYNLPKFGAATANVSAEVPDMDLKVEGAGLKIPKNGTTVDVAAQSIDIEGPSIDMKMTETDGVGKESRFKMPKFGISLPKVQRPDINVSLSKKDVDVSIPEAKIEVRKPELEMEPLQSEGELDGQGGKFQMARFGMSDVDITLPEAKAEVNLPDVEFKEPSAKVEVKAPEVQLSSVKGSPSKFKLPTFKFPKFGVATPNVSAEVPDIDKEIKVDGADMHISVPDTGVDVPQGKAEVHLPEVEVKEPSGDVVTDQQPGVEVDPKLKKRRFSLPRFSFSKSVKAPEVDVSLRDVNVAIPEGKVEVKGGEVDMKVPASDAEVDGQGGKIKIPKFGISMPKVTGPEIDLSLSKKDVDVTLPKAKVEVQLPDVELKEPSAEVKIKAPEIKVATKDTEGSPSKFKMPTFTLPKFGVGSPSATVEVPDTDKDVKIDGADIKIPEEVLAVDIAAPSVDIEGPSIDMKTTGIEHEGKGSKFKMPKFGISMPKVTGPEIDLSLSKKDVDVTLPKVTAEVQLPDAELKEPSAEVKIKAPEIKVATKDTEGSPSKFKMPTFTLPKFGVGSPSATVEVPDTDKDVKIDRADIKIPEEVLAVDIAAPSVDIEGPSIDMKTTGIEHEGKGSKFKMPKFGISMPKVTGPEIDLSLSKKDVDVTLPKAKAEVQVPDVELKKPSAEVKIKAPEIKVVTKDTEGSPSKFKMPTFTLPKFGVGTPSATIEVPDTDKDVKIDGADIEIPEEVLAVDIAAPSVEGPSIDMKTTGTEHEGKGSKFKMPKFGISMPKVTGPEIDLSLSNKDVDVTLPKAKAEVQVPDVELKKPSAEVKIKAPEIKVATKDTEGSPSKKFKMPTFKLPKFGVGSPSATVEVPDTDKDVKIDGADIKIPEEVLAVDIAAPSVDIEGPSIDMKTKGTEHEGKGSTFKMPKFGISMPKVTGPDIDLSLSKKDVDVTLPKAKVEVQLPDAELKEPSAEVKIKAPEIKVATKDTEGSPSKKFKMPTFTLPKFGVGTPSATVEVPDTDKDVKIDGADIKIPEEGLAVDIAAPSVDIEGPSIDMKTTGTEHEGKGSKFKMPTFGISMPKVTGPEIDLSLSKKDVDVTLPKAKAEVQVPDVELKKPSAEVKIKAPEIKVATKDTEGSPSKKFKMPTFKLPKFGVGSPSASVEVPDTDKDVKIDGADIKIPEEVLAVDIAAPSVDIEGPSIDMKTTGTEYEGKGSKFKMPKFGISMPKVTGPEIDLSLSKKDVDVTLPKAKTEVQLPDAELKEPSAEVKIKAPEIKVATKDTEGSPSKKFKMPTFKLPKFGVGSPSATVEVPDTDKDVKIDGADIKIPEEVLAVDIASPSVDIEGPSIDMKTKGTEHEGKGSKFKMPKFGISMPKVTGPDIDLSLSKKDVDVTLPKAKVEVQLPDAELKKPSAEVKIKAPEIKVATKDTEGSPSKFKMPTFTLPKFGVGTPSATIEVPDMDKDVKIDGADIKIPEEVLAVDIAAPSVEGPSIDVKTTGSEHEGKGSKFKMPKFGISMPKVTGPEIDLSLSKKDVDVTLPKAKAEVQVPDVELKKPSAEVEIKAPEIKVTSKDTEGSPSKFKMPTFKLPKFGVVSPSASIEVPDTDKDVKIDGADIKIPEEVLAVDIAAPSVDIEGPSIDMKTKGSEHEGKGSKFKMPKFGISMPKVTGPEIDLSLSKKDVDVTLPNAKAEVQLPDVDLKEPSAEVKIKAPEIKVATKDTEGSPSKFKMPTFTLPKFGVGTPSATVEVPDTDKDVKIDGADIKIPVEVLAVDIAAPSVEGPSIDMKTTGTEHEGKGSKFKMPKFGISMPKVTGPEIDLTLSKKDVDVTLPKAKAEVQLPDVELKKPSAEVEIKAPGIDVQTSNVEGSPSKFQMPTFKLPKFGVATPQVSVEVPDVEKVIQVDGGDLKSPQTKAEVKLPNVEIKESASSISVSQGDANLKKTKFSFPKFSFSKQSTKETEVDVSLPDVDVPLPEGNVEVKHPEVKLKSPEGDVVLDGQDSKFKMPNFGFSMPKVKGPEMDLSLSKKDVDVTLPEAKAEVQFPGVKIKQPSAKVEIKAPEIGAQTGDVGGSPSKLKMPTFTLPKFGVATPKVSVEVPDVEKDIKIDGAKLEVLKDGATVDVTTPSIDTEGLSVDVNAKGSEPEGSGSKFKMPKFGISMPKVTGPEIDLSLSKKDADVTLPEVKAEVKLPTVEVKEPEGAISVPDAPTVEVDAKSKRPNWTFPKFSFSRTGGKAPDVDVNLETPKVDVTTPEVKEEVCLPDVEVQGPSGAISVEEPLATELNANLRKPKFSLPRFSFSKSSVKEPEASAELPYVDGSLPEGEVKVKQPEMEIKAPELEAEHDGQGSKFKLPKFGITIPKAKGPEDLNASEGDVDITRGVQLPEIEVKESSASVEVKSKDVGGSPLKFKMPTLKIQKEVADADKVAETDRTKLKEDVTVNIKGPSLDIKTDVSKAEITDSEMPKTETDSVGSPSKFKLPSFKMPKLSFSRPKVEDEYVPVDGESKEDQLEMEVEPKAESKSPKMTLTSFGEILKNIDVEFDVSKTDKVEENLETSKEVHETDESSGKQLEAKERETSAKQDTTKSPERTGWFKFPRFGLSSPSEPAKKSPVGETMDEEISPTCSVQSSDAFADISSAMTSEHVGLSLSSPTKVTVKYSDTHTATDLGDMHGNIITSTTRTELISVEPNLPEKITILSSGVSSSSEDTLRLESGKIHVITSNIQATPEAQHARLLTAVQIQSAGGLPLKSEANEAASWTVEDSQSGRRTVFERHLVRETSSERSESKQTTVITKQITRMFDSSEPISGETASSIQRLRDSVHSEKMRFFDGAEK